MKTYRSIKNANQVKTGDKLVSFYPDSSEVWHNYTVNEVLTNGIELHCPSGALIYVSNETLLKDGEYFARCY